MYLIYLVYLFILLHQQLSQTLQASCASINSEEASKPGDSSKCCSSLLSDTLENGMSIIKKVEKNESPNKSGPPKKICCFAILHLVWCWKCRLSGSWMILVSIWFHHSFGNLWTAFPGVATSTLIVDTAFCSCQVAPWGSLRKGERDNTLGKGQRMCLKMEVYRSITQKKSTELNRHRYSSRKGSH